MRRFRRACRGQAFVELALVLFLFFMVITAVMQLVWIGSAQIRCQHAARRAAWLFNIYNKADLNHANDEIQAILPGCEKPVCLNGDKDEGMTYQVAYTVPAVGFFRLSNPKGFRITARSAVIAYNPSPIGAQGLNAVVGWVKSKLNLH